MARYGQQHRPVDDVDVMAMQRNPNCRRSTQICCGVEDAGTVIWKTATTCSASLAPPKS